MKVSLLLRVLVTASLLLVATGAIAQSGDVIISTNTSWAEGTYQLNSLTVNNGATLTVEGGSTVNVVGLITVVANSKILLQGKNTSAPINEQWIGAGVSLQAGNIQVEIGSQISADGQGYGTGLGPGAAASGDYGSGASHGGRGSGNSGPTYGSAMTPTDLGSGGRVGFPGSWSAGGGAIRLIVSGTLTNNGSISANGLNQGSYAAGASGGSIYVTTGTIAGSGVFTANGSAGSTGSGGGGRIALYFAANHEFNLASATSGPGGGTASVGTVYLLENGTNLYVNTNLYLPADTTASYASVTVSNGALLTLGGGSNIAVSGTVTATGNSIIALRSKNNTGQVNGQWQGTGVTINAGSIQVDYGSQINADGQGYGTGLGPGTTEDSGNYGSGASYGGRGSGNSGPTYGSAMTPTDLGSGGRVGLPGSWSAGGGAIRLIVSGTLTNNGSISANGLNQGSYAAGASGGSIYVTTGTIAGSGVFTANGSAGAGSSGGGGRIALYYVNNIGFSPTSLQAGGGGSTAELGSELFIDSAFNNVEVPGGRFVLDQDSSVGFHDVTLDSGASMIVGGGAIFNASGTLRVADGALLQLGSKNNSGLINGQWVGQGATIGASDLTVEDGGRIDADGQGYGTGLGPGTTVDSGNYSSGASYGGRGSGNSGPTYGSAMTPTDLGSGGRVGLPGSWSAGGGAIRLIVSGTLTNNGSISANGLTSGAYSAGASGGSVFVTTSTLGGSGTFTANGSSGTGGSGGGGGRIAICYGAGGFNSSAIMAGPGSGYAQTGTVTFPCVQTIVGTDHPALTFAVDGTSYTTTQTFVWSIGSTHTLDTPSPQGMGDMRYVFANWSDGGAQSHSVTVPTMSTTYTATFTTQYLLTTAASPAPGGTVSPATGYFSSGTLVNVSATSNSGYVFVNWSGDLTGSTNPTTITMSGPRSVTANYLPIYTLSIYKAGSGTVASTDGKISCGSRCSVSYTAGTSVTLTASATTGSVFAGWSGGGCSGIGNCTVSLNSDLTVTATFDLAPVSLNVTKSGAGSGMVTSSPTGINCGAICSASYPSGTSVTLTATADSSSNFGGWTGCDSTSGTTCTVAITISRTVMATFIANTGLRFIATTPCRVADTRNATGPFGGPSIAAGSARDFAIPSSACGIPSTAAAYALNVTVVPQGKLGFLTVWPSGQAQPLVSLLNSTDGRIKANAAIMAAGVAGAVSVFATDATDVVLDISGYFVPASDASALAFYPLTPCRVADTREANAPLGGPYLVAQQERAFPVRSSACGIPSTAQAYSLNFTAVPKGALGHLSAWPTGQPWPGVSVLNAPTGAVTANAALVPAGNNGSINLLASNDTDAVIDINGYFAPPTTGGLSLYALTPCRALDTRNTTGAFSGTIHFNVTATPCQVPANGQVAVLNATIVPPGSLGYLSLWPTGQTQPLVSTLNASDGAITSNMAIVPTTNGSLDAYASNTTQLLFDVNGYFSSTTGPPPSMRKFASLQSTNNTNGLTTFTPMINTFLTSDGTKISSKSIIDPGTGQPLTGEFHSIGRNRTDTLDK